MGLELREVPSRRCASCATRASPDRCSATRSSLTCSRCSSRAPRCWCWRRSSGSRTRSCSCSAASRSGFVPGLPEIDAAARARARRRPAAAALRRRRSSPRCATCAPTCARSGCSRSGSSCVTTVVVAVVAHAIVPELPWAAAFVLGAVVSPTDPIAATAIARRLGVPRRDRDDRRGREPRQRRRPRSSPTASRSSPRSAGTFSLWEARLAFVLNVAGGIAIGLASAGSCGRCGAGSTTRRPRSTISLLTGYFAYLPAEALGVSGVLAAVTAGRLRRLVHARADDRRDAAAGRSASGRSSPSSLNALLFMLVGLQLPAILDGLDADSAADARSGTRRRSCWRS